MINFTILVLEKFREAVAETGMQIQAVWCWGLNPGPGAAKSECKYDLSKVSTGTPNL